MDWGPYAVGGAAARPDSFTGLQPEFATSVYQMVQDAQDQGIPLQITSAYRSPEVQARLYEAALKKYGSPEAARKWVAPPGNSQHNFGTAVDLAVNNSLIRDADSPEARWIAQNAPNYGLDVPMSWEPWQVEQAGARGAPQGGTQMARPPVSGTPTMSTQGQAEEEPLPFFQRPGVGNALDSLAIALQGMTIDPNETLMQMSANRIAGRRKDKQTQQKQNRTVEALKRMGAPAELIQMAEAGYGSAAMAQMAKLRSGPSYTQVRGSELGMEGEAANALYNRSADGKITSIGGGGNTEINMGDPIKMLSDGSLAIRDDSVEGGVRFVKPPGSKAAEAEQDAARRQGVINRQTEAKTHVITRDVNRLIDLMDDTGMFKLPEAGTKGEFLTSEWLGPLRNQEAVDFQNTLKAIQSQVAFDRLQQMREASKTGGALGAVSQNELGLLISALGALEQDTSPKVLKANLEFIRDTMNKIESDPVASHFYYYGPGQGGVPGMPQSGGQSGGQSSGQGGGQGGDFSVNGVID